MQQVTNNAMHQCRDRQFGFRLQIRLQSDDPLFATFEFVFARQTAESFTSSAASATAAAFFLNFNRHLNLQSSGVV